MQGNKCHQGKTVEADNPEDLAARDGLLIPNEDNRNMLHQTTRDGNICVPFFISELGCPTCDKSIEIQEGG